MIQLNDYQTQAAKTAVYPYESRIAYLALGLNGEAGEVAEVIKKSLRSGLKYPNEEEREKLKLELGDVLWYLAILASELNYSLESIALANLEKLNSRKERGVIQGDGDFR
jgi:NTP pyrophosphatase (non-canonical NTP hydrolase)